tara:strand:+ start:61188 stop:62711 length:1524 start_codon:yes stop_codon:yes gene_type:complete
MRKLLIGLGLLLLLLVSIPAFLLASGTTDSSSLRMLFSSMMGIAGPAANSDIVRQQYNVPDGFTLELYDANLPRARFLLFTPSGDLLVSRPHSGDILLLGRDADGDGKPDARATLIEGLERPLGMDISGGWLYIAESNRVSRIRFDSDTGTVVGALETVVEGLTDNGNHWSKTIRIGQDQKLYLAQGSTCNICEEEDSRRATLMRFQLDGSQPEIIATGLRNSVGFDWAPWNGALYATENGRDLLGDGLPPCELNQIEAGNFYGWPYFYGDNIADPDMGDDPFAKDRDPTAPAHNFRAHNAPLGMTFLDANTLPRSYERAALVALHGSWNRSSPDGYKVVSLHWGTDGIEERDFLTGFNRDGTISGRPVDVAQGPDGAIYISDDYAGAIYRVRYGAADNNNAAAFELPTVKRLDAQPPEWVETANMATMADQGNELYQRYQCQSCHEEGENPKRLENLNERLGYAAVIDVLAAPPSPMPLFPLTESEQRELAVFLLWQPPESSADEQ